MVTMDQHLAELVRSGRITLELALERAANDEDLRRLLGDGADRGGDTMAHDLRVQGPRQGREARRGQLEADDASSSSSRKLREMGYVPVAVEPPTASRSSSADIKIPGFGDGKVEAQGRRRSSRGSSRR